MSALRLLFYAVALELTLGGGGRLTAIGPVSLRMVLFAAAMVASGVYIVKFKQRLPKGLVWLLVAFTAMLAVGSIVGVVSGGNVWEDVKPLLYFYLLPFVYFSNYDVRNVFKYGSVGMAVVFIFILILIHTGIVPFLSFYHTVLDTGEFFFRGEITFFYKGFLYLCIGFIFLLADHGKKWQIILVLVAIILTVTRGFWLSLLLTYGCYFILFSEKKIHGLALVIISIVLLFYSRNLIENVSKRVNTKEEKTYLLGDRTHSDNERLRQLAQVRERITPTSAIIGHGFGHGVPIRPVHMEISYLEIFHKQGIIGLAIWFVIFLYGCRRFMDVRSDPGTVPFFLSFVFVFIQSLSNQFINNPIGLFMIIVAVTHFEKKIPHRDVDSFSSSSL